ncbi:alpha/beta fold hydrolase [Hydrogenophaga sp. BPS33]|uniref:alpha/beta fold hydrolase n=1 Tax=Hydrogenophaga sp. BPS33 TaxID=2651974 RepID=UPI00131F5DD6|nr:alpha/beta fold hydrolase [Hydrogenophaga sp. BPS33]QHE83715.1 alpha/beta fold hydrolase [Hydrogenophaga sp. BPS33]
MKTLVREHGVRLAYVLDDHTDPWRDAQTIIFVHGFTENLHAWRCWVPHFSRDYRVVRFDQRGFGQSGAVPVDFNFSTQMLVDDARALIDEVSPNRPVHLVSGKSGGIAAVATAIAHPDRVASLTLTSPALKGPETPGWLEHIDRYGMASWARWTMGDRLGKQMPAAGVDWWVQLMGQTAPSTAHAYLRWVASVDLTQELARIHCPTLIVGNDSRRRGLALFREYLRRLPVGELAVIDEEGYHVAAAAPDACARATREFLVRHPAASAIPGH